MQFFSETVLEVWRQRHASVRQERTRLEGEVAELCRRMDELDSAFIFQRSVDQKTYERQRDLLREKHAAAELRLEDMAIEDLDIDGVLGFARHVLTDASRLWGQASLHNKQRMQQAFFPEGVEITLADGIRTSATCLAFTELQPLGRGEKDLASPTGFEPVSPP